MSRLNILRSVLCLGLALVASAIGAPARAADGAPAPYDRDLQRLAEIMGALHHLRPLCGANEGTRWRSEMEALIEADAPSGERRDRLVANFNRGYRGYRQAYRSCTPAAEVVIRRYLLEGARIAREVTGRYAN